MYEQYRADPDSVGEAWREFFADYKSMTAPPPTLVAPPQPRQPPAGHRRSGRPAPRNHLPRPQSSSVASEPAAAATRRSSPHEGEAQRSPSSRGRFFAALPRPSPPTWSAASRSRRRPASATSRPSCSRSTARSSTATAPQRSGQGQLHPPHRLRRGAGDRRRRAHHGQHFVEGADGKPRIVATRPSTWASPSTSTRATAPARWSCPCIRDADTLDFAGFLAAYEELIRKVGATS